MKTLDNLEEKLNERIREELVHYRKVQRVIDYGVVLTGIVNSWCRFKKIDFKDFEFVRDLDPLALPAFLICYASVNIANKRDATKLGSTYRHKIENEFYVKNNVPLQK